VALRVKITEPLSIEVIFREFLKSEARSRFIYYGDFFLVSF